MLRASDGCSKVVTDAAAICSDDSGSTSSPVVPLSTASTTPAPGTRPPALPSPRLRVQHWATLRGGLACRGRPSARRRARVPIRARETDARAASSASRISGATGSLASSGPTISQIRGRKRVAHRARRDRAARFLFTPDRPRKPINSASAGMPRFARALVTASGGKRPDRRRTCRRRWSCRGEHDPPCRQGTSPRPPVRAG